MASHPVPAATSELDEKTLNREDGWDLIFSLFGSAKELYAINGGGGAWLRTAWGERELDDAVLYPEPS